MQSDLSTNMGELLRRIMFKNGGWGEGENHRYFFFFETLK